MSQGLVSTAHPNAIKDALEPLRLRGAARCASRGESQPSWQSTIHGLLEVHVSRAREFLREHKAKTYEVMVECAEAFSRRRHVPVEVIKGPPECWLDRHAGLIYGGFPQMLTALAEAHPEALDPSFLPAYAHLT